MAASADAVALYWDFENLHASLVDQFHGQGAYVANRFRPQDELVEVSTIVETVLSIGPIAINRAFANWLSFARYRQALLHNAVELIQVFPPGANAKNGADIKLCLDVMDDMARFPHIGTIVVVGGDSDYMPLSYKVKAAGRTLVGIGSRRTTNQHWARSCHEFKFYESLLPAASTGTDEPAASPMPPGGSGAPHADASSLGASSATAPSAAAAPTPNGAEPPPAPTPTGLAAGTAEPAAAEAPLASAAVASPAGPGASASQERHGDGTARAAGDDATPSVNSTEELRRLLDVAVGAQQRQRELRDLVTKAVVRLGQIRGERWIQKARLRPFIQRMDPTFHESSYGYDSFSELLASLDNLLETRRGEFDHELRLREPSTPVGPAAGAGGLPSPISGP